MVEKYFTTSTEHEIPASFSEFRKQAKKLYNEVFMPFCKEHGLTCTDWVPYTTSLVICATEEDKNKFREQIQKDSMFAKRQSFKRNSKLHKAWVKACEGIEFPTQAAVIDYFAWGGGRMQSNWFIYDGMCYLYLGREIVPENERVPDGFTEILGSEYHRAKELKEAAMKEAKTDGDAK